MTALREHNKLLSQSTTAGEKVFTASRDPTADHQGISTDRDARTGRYKVSSIIDGGWMDG